MEILETIVIALVALLSVAVIVVIMLQSGKEAGLSGALSGSSDTYMSKNKKDSLDAKLASITKWIVLAWIVLILILSLI